MRIVGVAVLLASFASFSQTNSPPNQASNSVSESVLLANIPQLLVKCGDLVRQGWDTAGQNTNKYIYLYKTNYSFAGITGLASFQYVEQSLIEFYFSNDSVEDFAKLDKFLCNRLNSSGKRSRSWTGDTRLVKWEVTGKRIKYEILLSEAKFGNEFVRALHISLRPIKPP
jgi:hypothetical protein